MAPGPRSSTTCHSGPPGAPATGGPCWLGSERLGHPRAGGRHRVTYPPTKTPSPLPAGWGSGEHPGLRATQSNQQAAAWPFCGVTRSRLSWKPHFVNNHKEKINRQALPLPRRESRQSPGLEASGRPWERPVPWRLSGSQRRPGPLGPPQDLPPHPTGGGRRAEGWGGAAPGRRPIRCSPCFLLRELASEPGPKAACPAPGEGGGRAQLSSAGTPPPTASLTSLPARSGVQAARRAPPPPPRPAPPEGPARPSPATALQGVRKKAIQRGWPRGR